MNFLHKSIAASLLLALITGCGSHKHSPRRYVLVFDVSDQTQDRLLAYAAQAYNFEAQLDEDDDLEVFTFAHGIDLVYHDHPIFDRNEFNDKIASTLTTTHSDFRSPGTKADVMLGRVIDECRTSKAPIMAVVFTDGGVEDLSSAALARIHKAVTSASHAPALKCLFVTGVDQQWRDQWITWLKPLGDVAQVRGLNDGQQGLDNQLLAFGGSR